MLSADCEVEQRAVGHVEERVGRAREEPRAPEAAEDGAGVRAGDGVEPRRAGVGRARAAGLVHAPQRHRDGVHGGAGQVGRDVGLLRALRARGEREQAERGREHLSGGAAASPAHFPASTLREGRAGPGLALAVAERLVQLDHLSQRIRVARQGHHRAPQCRGLPRAPREQHRPAEPDPGVHARGVERFGALEGGAPASKSPRLTQGAERDQQARVAGLQGRGALVGLAALRQVAERHREVAI